MLTFFRHELQFYVMVGVWVLAAIYMPVAVYALLPLSILVLRNREQFPELLFGFIMVLALSDIHKDIHSMAVFKSVKNIYIVVLAALFLNETRRFVELSKVFTIFLPFVAYSVIPLIFSPNLSVSVQKTLSYDLLLLIVPNFVLYNFRVHGWDFCRNLIYFLVSLLLFGLYFRFSGEGFVAGRFRGLFGNPNGLALYCYLCAMLLAVVISLNSKIFKQWEKWLLYGIILYFLLASGSRSSLIALFILFVFQRFFSGSVFIGFVALLVFMGLFEFAYSNIGEIAAFLGAEEFLRVKTLESGSGRYFAWEFAWEKLQDFFVFGGGFGTDEWVMRGNYDYLEQMGHQGGVHNSYLSLWFDVGIIGLLLYFRSMFLLFIKASKRAPMSMAVMFSMLFSVTYESWLVGSLNPFTILFLIAMTLLSEEEIAISGAAAEEEGVTPVEQPDPVAGVVRY